MIDFTEKQAKIFNDTYHKSATLLISKSSGGMKTAIPAVIDGLNSVVNSLTDEQLKQIADERGFSIIETDKLEKLKLRYKELYEQSNEILAVMFENDLLNENGKKRFAELVVGAIRYAIKKTEIEVIATPELFTNSHNGKALICESVCLNFICNEILAGNIKPIDYDD